MHWRFLNYCVHWMIMVWAISKKYLNFILFKLKKKKIFLNREQTVNGGPLQSCRIFRQLVVQNLCILHRDVNRTGLKLYYSMRQQVAEKFWSCQKVLFWTTSWLSDNCYLTTVRARCGDVGCRVQTITATVCSTSVSLQPT